MTDKIKEIRERHENGKSRNSYYRLGEVIDSLNYLHGLDQLHDKDDGWETQFTNVVWWTIDAIEGSPWPPGVSPKIWEAFIVGDFDSTLGVATDGARHHLKEAIEDRATLLAEIDRLTRERDEARAEAERLREALEYIVNVCPAIDPDGDQAHERARKALEAKP